ncbi:MAG: hypothetical protein CFE23_12590 [Flavobacterium sp. BFFFF1]|uniref:hypothetical protein n=1 Tax=Flavobacterium sp. BFFFF1 TaxID=2015557 RepID=UPI000BCEED0F|nr:hypothetical protein [Flavobacterium sp. BFFFF1]OYU79736.1 MAG: hypothetical protein CFE23_12590 [Flavobacterium sp. BFFFF1]
MATKKQPLYTYLLKVTTDRFAIFDDNCPLNIGKGDDDSEIYTNIGVKFGVDANKQAIAVVFSFELSCNEKTMLIVEPALHFGVEEESWKSIFNPKTNLIKLDHGTAAHLLGICIGTARGILHTKTEGTRLNGYFVPLMHPTEIITEDIIIHWEEPINVNVEDETNV